MTDPELSRDALAVALGDVSAQLEASRREMATLRTTTEANTEANEKLREENKKLRARSRFDRLMIWIGFGSLAFDLIVTAWLSIGQAQQRCRDERSGKFFAYEIDKVCGQVIGEAMIDPPTRETSRRIEAVCGTLPSATTPHPRAGFRRFEASSLEYLERIKSVRDHC